MTPDRARALMHEWTENPALRVHMECVAACMAAYASVLDPANADRWFVAGILHDFDYQRHPTGEEHPAVGVGHLRAHTDVDEEVLRAILAHASERTGVPRDTPMAKALFAVDELSGFIVACAKVRPAGIADLAASSVSKKLKDHSFAAAVSREDVARGASELAPLTGKDNAAHVQFCIDAIRAHDSARSLGLTPTTRPTA